MLHGLTHEQRVRILCVCILFIVAIIVVVIGFASLCALVVNDERNRRPIRRGACCVVAGLILAALAAGSMLHSCAYHRGYRSAMDRYLEHRGK
jgi:threonine/homoserine/homoserine lactone efflux protein